MDTSPSHNKKSEEKAKLTTELANIKAALAKKAEDKERTLTLIRDFLTKGMPDEELIKMGISAEEIEEAKQNPEDIEKQRLEKEHQEELEKQKTQAIEDSLVRIRTLSEKQNAVKAELVALRITRARLLAAEEYINSLTKTAEPTPAEATSEDNNADTEEEKLAPLSLPSSREIVEEYNDLVDQAKKIWFNKKKLQKIEERQEELQRMLAIAKQRESEEVDATTLEEEKAERKQQQEAKEVKEKEERIKKIKEQIALDRKTKPYFYYIVEKATNIGTLFKRNEAQETDLRTWSVDGSVNAKVRSLIPAGENAGFQEFNLYGFIKVIKNIKEITNNKGDIVVSSPNAKYQIVGPDGTIVQDDIKGYDEATRIYDEATEAYRIKVEEEFKNLNK